MGTKVILFGAGKNGIEALNAIGRKNVSFFCDNDIKKCGSIICGKEVIPFNRMVDLYKMGYSIVVTPYINQSLRGQLRQNGIYDYLVYRAVSNEQLRHPFEMRKEEKKSYERKNAELDQCVKECETKEFIGNIEGLQNIITPLLRNEFLAYKGKQGESNHYGNLEAILKYADIDLSEGDMFPMVSHVDTYADRLSVLYDSALVISGSYYMNTIHEKYAYIPVFTVGPYIHYAENMYDQNQRKKIKEENGRVLTIFMPHSIETFERGFNEKSFLDQILSNYREKFDSIWACVYWADINKPICEDLQRAGIKLVCAGCRFDLNFDRRIKTILDLSDAIVCGGMGTYINYALYYDKPVAYIRCELEADQWEMYQYERDPNFTDDMRMFEQLFNEKLEITPMQKEFINKVAGFDLVRDKEYIQNILKISKDIWAYCDYDTAKYPIGVYSAYDAYIKENDIVKAQMLRTAVGKNFI